MIRNRSTQDLKAAELRIIEAGRKFGWDNDLRMQLAIVHDELEARGECILIPLAA